MTRIWFFRLLQPSQRVKTSRFRNFGHSSVEIIGLEDVSGYYRDDMSLTPLFYGLLVFIICLLTHVIVWRVRIPVKGALTLLILFLAVPAAVLVVIMISGEISQARILFLVEIYFLHFSLSLSYIASYPAARAVSPSLDILLIIVSSQKGVLTEEEIVSRYNDKNLVTNKVDALRVYDLIAEDRGNFRLKPLAKCIVLVFSAYRRLLNLKVGKG